MACVAASLIIEWWVRDCGFIMTPDSDNYISASKSFKFNGLFLSPDGSYYTNWPPLFPIILSLFEEPAQAMVWIHVLCKITIAFVVFFLADRFLDTLLFKIIFVVAVFFSVHVLLISIFLWSEIIFMTLLLLHLYVSLNTARHSTYYYLLIGIGVLLCLQRNAGLFWVAATALWLVSANPIGLKNNVVKSIIYFMVCASALIFWHFYNVFFMVGSTPFYARSFFAQTVNNVQMMLFNLGRLFFPLPGLWAAFAGVIIVSAIVFCVYKYFRADNSLRLLGLCVMIYTAGFLPIPKLDIHDMERYFAVILPVFLLFPLKIIEYWATTSNKLIVVTVCLSFWLMYSFARTRKNAIQWHAVSCRGVYYK
jgi:hypothetical protein